MSASNARHAFVDHAKGLCIILVVLMHSTLGVEKVTGAPTWLHEFIDWARPFRMPDFFFISGLFLASALDRQWRRVVDGKILHFLYFYLLWLTIQALMRAPGIMQEAGLAGVAGLWAEGLVQPFGTLWFIYMLPLFFAAIKLLRPVPPLAVFVGAALLEMSHIDTGWLVIDEFAARFVYVFAGCHLAPAVFDFARGVAARPLAVVLTALLAWASIDNMAVQAGIAAWPGIGIPLGFVGTAGIIALGVLLSRTRLAWLIAYCGANSIVIYLAFSVFMAPARVVLMSIFPLDSPALVALLTTAISVSGPILLFQATRATRFAFLFNRPAWARLTFAVEADRAAGPAVKDAGASAHGRAAMA